MIGNTSNIHLNFEIRNNEKTIADVKEIIEIFLKENISLNNWGLFENPIDGCYCFFNSKEHQYVSFVNYFTEDERFVPTHLDEDSIEVQSDSIKHAIEQY
ncbi:cupin superfamily acireductone dioxygenase involved in methionine salvage [Paenibacillus sp. PastF-3]|uniref:hypothetical protein n=1 Tax=Paenibacillus sp. PastF-3 TaxID=2940626 RepID=UPI001D93835B|nr:hypothetical protein [Paenibacillus sp. PastF-3]MBY3621403.1 hypothetical protein [Acinetobacter sp. CUI P1]MDH6372980.1 cupin superfamily acireductone dioxygenase involved in methionine salvage [Paenibacillus sp. PastF-3]